MDTHVSGDNDAMMSTVTPVEAIFATVMPVSPTVTAVKTIGTTAYRTVEARKSESEMVRSATGAVSATGAASVAGATGAASVAGATSAALSAV